MRTSILWVVFVAALFALPSLNGGLVSDDYELITESRINSLQDIEQALTNPSFNALYRPIPRLFLGFNWMVGGLHPLGYHMLSAVIHIGSAIVLFGVLSTVLPSTRISYFASLLFAVHFIHVEPVYWVAAQTELFAAFFFLVAAWCILQPGGRTIYKKISMVSFMAALLSNEMAVTFPLFVAGVNMERASGPFRQRLTRGIRSGLPFLAILLGYGLMRRLVGASFPGTSKVFDFSVRPGLILKNIEQYTVQMFVPVRTILDIRGPETYGALTEAVRTGPGGGGFYMMIILGMILLASGMVIGVIIGGRPVKVGLAWAGITALPFLMMEGTGLRYLYLPSAGFLLAATGVLSGIADRRRNPAGGNVLLRRIVGAAVVVSLLLSVEQARWWDRAGRECERVIHRVTSKAEMTSSDTPLYVFDIPRRLHGAYVFHNGFEAALRLQNTPDARQIRDGERAMEHGEAIPQNAVIYRYRSDRD